MQYREDKKKGGSLSVLGMGCMRFPGTVGVVDKNKTEKLCLAAVEKGINYFDTAYIYPGSEDALGTIIQRNTLRDRIFIATKLPQLMCNAPTDFDRFFNEQKRRLCTDYIDYYLMHNVTGVAQWDNLKRLGIEEWIRNKKASGEVRRVGFSYHGPHGEFEAILNDYDWDFVQIQYNYINVNYQAGQAGLYLAAKKGLPVIIMEPLLGGKLATGLPKTAQKLFKDADPATSPVQWALNWLWDQPEVTVVLSGMNQLAQINENTAFADKSRAGMMTDAQHMAVVEVIKSFDRSYRLRCTGCNYCLPCPKGINIPGCFASYNTSFVMGWFTGVKQYFLNTGLVSSTPKYPRHCLNCGKCEKHCPQGIEIRRELKRVTRRFEKIGIRTAAWVVRKFFNRGKSSKKRPAR